MNTFLNGYLSINPLRTVNWSKCIFPSKVEGGYKARFVPNGANDLNKVKIIFGLKNWWIQCQPHKTVLFGSMIVFYATKRALNLQNQYLQNSYEYWFYFLRISNCQMNWFLICLPFHFWILIHLWDWLFQFLPSFPYIFIYNKTMM